MTRRLVRSTKVPTALALAAPLMRSPSQCPGNCRSSISGGRKAARPAIKLHADALLFDVVCHFLRLLWSPEQIALTLAHIFPKGHEHRVSHETIYNCIYAQPVGELRKELIACMRQAHNKRVPRSKGQDRRGQIR